MTKILVVDPKEARRPDTVTFSDIPVNTYQKTVADEKENFTKAEFLRIYRDMLIIREFESMLNAIKIAGQYEGIEYNHPGPAHLGIGQEAAYVGQAFDLDIEDYTFGSHRSHGEILAKGLSAIDKLSEEALETIMSEFWDGETYNVVKAHTKATDKKEIAKEFLIYGTLAEIWARKTGFNRGLGGSMHAFFTPFGIFPNNAIVGGSGDISVGGALYKKCNQKKGIVICNIGDGSLGCGPVFEGLNLAAMGQFKTLWRTAITAAFRWCSISLTTITAWAARHAARPWLMTLRRASARASARHSCMPSVWTDTTRWRSLTLTGRKRKILEEGDGPVLLDVVTYRYKRTQPVGCLHLPVERRDRVLGRKRLDRGVQKTTAGCEDCEGFRTGCD